jgi:hypothetical protein
MISNPPFQTTGTWGWGLRPFDYLPDDSFVGGQGLPNNGKDILSKTPGSYQWNLTIERELWRDTKLELAYVANRGHHIPTQFRINMIKPEDRLQYGIWELDGDDSTDGEVLRPLRELGKGDTNDPNIYSRSADSWYHSFQMYLVKRFSNRFSYQLSYTWSQFLSTAGGLGHVGGNEISDIYNVGYDRGHPNFYRPHILTANVIYRTPGLSDKNAFVRGLLGDWESAFIFTANSGVPITVGCCDNFNGIAGNRPDQVAGTEGPKTAEQWFNLNAFVPPDRVGRLGYSARGQITSPGIHNWDISLMKNFPGLPWFSSEGATLQVRAEFFNAFNWTQFRDVDAGFSIDQVQIDDEGYLTNWNMNNNNFGRVTRMREPREIQIALKIIW